MKENLYLMGDVARRLGVPPHRVAYLYLTRKLAEPEIRMGGRRMFTEEDIERIAQALGKREGK